MRLIDEIGAYAQEKINRLEKIKLERKLNEAEVKEYLGCLDTIRRVKSNDFVSETYLREMNRKYPNLHSFYD